jgi:hypothetical protein
LHRYLKHTISELSRCRIGLCTFGQRYLTIETAVAAFAAIISLALFFFLMLPTKSKVWIYPEMVPDL